MLLGEELPALAQGSYGADLGEDLDVARLAPPHGEQILVDLLRYPEVFLNMVLPLVGSPTEYKVREDSEQELLSLLLVEGVKQLALVAQDDLPDEVAQRHALPILLDAPPDVASCTDGSRIFKLVEEGHTDRLRGHPLPSHLDLGRAEDAEPRRHLAQRPEHLSALKEVVEHGLERVRSDRLLHSEGAHRHVGAEAPLVQQRLDLVAAKGAELGIGQVVELEVFFGRSFLVQLLYQQRHGCREGRGAPFAARRGVVVA
mmetsp:Transcript_32071/g.81401  ORF Transcript_32071/g.81401 Transcript_32071/m.81401 type:complete len:258 (+) Transcript_32071:194-967(+)